VLQFWKEAWKGTPHIYFDRYRLSRLACEHRKVNNRNFGTEELMEHPPKYYGKVKKALNSPHERCKIRLFVKRLCFSIISH